jgi:nitrate/TMAO reductase-like tetraheme cytochrome c subunit
VGIRSLVRRRRGLLVSIGIVIVAGYLGVNLLAYSLTYKPEACLACHIMKPYYDNWRSSGHNRIGCIDCHPYRPSTIVQSSIRYLAGTYKLPLKSRVEDKECLMCHRDESIKVTSFKGTPFNHLEHTQKMKRGKMLHCTSCHYSLVQTKSHMDVDQGVCTLCHFYTVPPQYNQNCIVCHGTERRPVRIGEVEFSHESFLKTGSRCVECHSQTVTGEGEPPEERCSECHVGRTAEGRDAARLHQIHISERYINCFSCHTRIEHGKETIRFSPAIDLACNQCHASAHSPSRDMYMGIGSQEVKDAPSAMYVSKVRCTACHALEKSIEGKNVLSRTWASKKKSCILCHKPGYEKMAEDWKKGMVSFTEGLSKILDQYGKVLDQRKGPAGLVKDYGSMVHDLQFLTEARGEHNIRYAFEIGKHIAAGVQDGERQMHVTEKLSIPEYIARPDGYCLFCHATYRPEKKIALKGQKAGFDHEQHVEMGTECTKCHDAKLHRMGSLQTGACKECHQDTGQ